MEGNFVVVFGKTENFDSVKLYHKKQNKVESIIHLGNNLYTCSFLNKTYKSLYYFDTVYSNLKDTVIYFRDCYSRVDSILFFTEYAITVSGFGYSKTIEISEQYGAKTPVLSKLSQIKKGEFKTKKVNMNIQVDNSKGYIIEYYETDYADTTICYSNIHTNEYDQWLTYWSRYSRTKGSPIGL